jgi:hypothetical protein
MRTMEFIGQNLLNTTTMVTSTGGGSGTVAYLFDRNISLSYQSDGYTDDTSMTITVTFDNPINISRVMLQNHNLKNYVIYGTGPGTTGGITFSPAINLATNSDTSNYHAFNTVTVDTVVMQLNNVITVGEERTIGELIIGDSAVTFDYNPAAANYDPKLYKQKIKHIMPDGGTNLFIVGNKFQANITLKFAGESFKDSLRTVYDAAAPLYFVPEGTTAAWNGEAHEVVWVNDWDFTYSENSKSQGYDGKITIEETPNT